MQETAGEIMSNVLSWTPIYGHTRFGRPAKTYINQLRADIGCLLEVLPKAMTDKNER